MRILIVEDEMEMARQLRRILEGYRYMVEVALDGEEALDKVFDQAFDLLILDIMLPKRDGLSVLREIRQVKIDTPVLLLTAKCEIDDKIKGLDLGADDYLAKPFSIDELLARVRALLRRASAIGAPILKIGDIRLNTITREVNVGGKIVQLTPKEFSIFEFLLYNKNRAVSRFSLSEHVWGEDFDPFSMSNYIDVHIKNLRHKTDDKGKFIETFRGFGYILREEIR